MKGNFLKNKEFCKIIKASKLLKARRVILFGSQLGNKKRPNDIDLCILTKNETDPLELQTKFRLKLWEIGYQWKWPLDLHIFSEKNFNERNFQGDPFIKEIQKGIILYG